MTVRLDSSPAGPLLLAAEKSRPDTVDAALVLAASVSGERVVPGTGNTVDLWEALATLSAHDLAIGRAVEPHWDAVSILVQAGEPIPTGAWGVFAAEGGPDPVIATPGETGWTLTGTKLWCSLAADLDHALISAADEDGGRRLFAIDLHSPSVEVEPGSWVARGLVEVPSGPIRLRDTPARPIGDPGWYLTRPGFENGAIGVAACWFGGAVGIARAVHQAATTKPNPHLLAHLGRIDQLLEDGRRALLEAAHLVDSAEADTHLLSRRVRATIASGCEEIIVRAGHALGPAPLALNAGHAKRVADLQLYIRQHHAERDFESLGSALAGMTDPW